MEIILNTVDEVLPQEQLSGILTLLASFFHVDVLHLKRNQISVFLYEKAGDFTGCQHRVDSFEEGLILDLGIGENEGDCATSGTSNVVKLLDILFELSITELFVKSDLEESLSADEGGKLGQGLLTGTTHTDKECITTSSVDNTGNLEQVEESIVENDKGHLL